MVTRRFYEEQNLFGNRYTSIVVSKNPEPWGFGSPFSQLDLIRTGAHRGKHEGDGPATAIFHISRRLAWRRPAPAARGDWYDSGDPRGRISRRSPQSDVRNVGCRPGHGSEWCPALDRIDHADCERTSGAGHLRHRPFVVSPTHAKSIRYAAACGSRSHRRCRRRFPWARNCFGGPASIRATRDHHSSPSKAARIVKLSPRRTSITAE